MSIVEGYQKWSEVARVHTGDKCPSNGVQE
jgi:hypothetical protein